jgi:hypothetical protein
MSSKSENTFGKRLKNCEDVINIVNTFNNFKPLKLEDAYVELTKLVSDIKNADQEEASALQQYSVSTDTRVKLITSDENSLKKNVSTIRAYITAMYGKTDKQFININNVLKQITGTKTQKNKENIDEKSVSSYQQSYASITQAFSDLVAMLSTLIPVYNPTNENITLVKLKEKYEQIQLVNTLITTNYNVLNNARQKRDELFQELKIRIQRIKKTVQSQYGTSSSEYEKIKGFKV